MPTDPLDSENWISESSIQSQDAEGDDSLSPSPPPSNCDSTSTLPASVTLKEKAVAGGMGPIQGLGYTGYKSHEFTTKVFCNGKTGQWVRRVITASFQQEQLVQPRDKEITVARINRADCQTLWDMGIALKQNMLLADAGDPYTPRDIIEAHEKVHKDINLEDVKTLYANFVGVINAISVACAGKDFEAAMKATLPGASDARLNLLNAIGDKALDNKAHKQKQRFLDAVTPKAKAWYNKVRNRMIAKRCQNILPPL